MNVINLRRLREPSTSILRGRNLGGATICRTGIVGATKTDRKERDCRLFTVTTNYGCNICDDSVTTKMYVIVNEMANEDQDTHCRVVYAVTTASRHNQE